MSSVKTRVAITGGKYLLTHPSSRITRFVVRFAVRKISRKVAEATHAEAIPATRGSRLVTVGGVLVVAGGIVLVARKAAKPARAASVHVPPPHAPFPPAAPPETRDAPSTSPTTSVVAEVAALAGEEVGDGDDAIVARVQATLFGGAPPLGVTVESASGVVTLRGSVADEEAEGRIVRDAEAVEGVKAVQSELQTAGAEPGTP